MPQHKTRAEKEVARALRERVTPLTRALFWWFKAEMWEQYENEEADGGEAGVPDGAGKGSDVLRGRDDGVGLTPGGPCRG